MNVAVSKFSDPVLTARGERRARVALQRLETLWFNTGTLCNIECRNCYIESSPRNDSLVYLARDEVLAYLDEIARDRLPTRLVGFTGGEPFMNRDLPSMLADCLARGFEVLVLTNAMKPMMNRRQALLDLKARFPRGLTLRVSLDHHAPGVHDRERGDGSWAATLQGIAWLVANGFAVNVASRRLSGETEAELRHGFASLFAARGIPLDAADPVQLVVFPEMDPARDTPEITEACWGILHRSPESVMCATQRMVVRRKGEAGPRVVACTLLPQQPGFDLGATLAEAARPVALNHPWCSSFCVLGGGSCAG